LTRSFGGLDQVDTAPAKFKVPIVMMKVLPGSEKLNIMGTAMRDRPTSASRDKWTRIDRNLTTPPSKYVKNETIAMAAPERRLMVLAIGSC